MEVRESGLLQVQDEPLLESGRQTEREVKPERHPCFSQFCPEPTLKPHSLPM